MPRKPPEKPKHSYLDKPVLSRKHIRSIHTPASAWMIPRGATVTFYVEEGGRRRSYFGRRTEKGVTPTHRAISTDPGELIHDRIEGPVKELPIGGRAISGRRRLGDSMARRRSRVSNVTEIEFHPPRIVDAPAFKEGFLRDQMRRRGKLNPKAL